MADKDYVIRLRVEAGSAKTELSDFIAKAEGVNAPMKRIAKNYEDIQAKSDPVFKALLTQQREVEKATKAAADAVKYYGVSQDQANATLRRTTDYYGQFVTKAREAAVAQSMLGKAMTGVQGQMVALSAGAGPVATFLSGLGPYGIAAAAGVGLVTAAFAEMRRTSDVLTKEADALTNMSEVTGMSTSALQAITMEAAKHGVSMEQASGAVVKFTSSWADARDGGGDMLKKLREIDPALAAQMQTTKDSATAFDILTRAIAQADKAGDIATRNALARAAGGRGGVLAFTGLSTAIDSAGGLDGLTKGATEAGKVIRGELLVEIDNLKDELDETKKRADLMMGSIGAKQVLEADLAWQKLRLSIAATLNERSNQPGGIPWPVSPMDDGAAWGRNDEPAKPLPPSFADRFSASDNSLKPVKPADATLDTKAQLANQKERVSLLGAAVAIAEALKAIAESRTASK